MGEKTLDLRREDEGREVRKVSGSSVSKNFGLLTIPFFEGNSTAVAPIHGTEQTEGHLNDSKNPTSAFPFQVVESAFVVVAVVS